MNSGYFVTGTDTEVGKTLVSVALIHALRRDGLIVAGMKPVASGCTATANGLSNPDADRIAEASSIEANYDLVSPYRFLPPIAPHIAAQESGIQISLENMVSAFRELTAVSDRVVVEGVGGWQVPISEDCYMSDLAAALQLPVIIVVGGRLGCINHALLTAESVRAKGLTIAGWVFNQVDPGMERMAQVRAALEKYMPAGEIATIPYTRNPDPLVISRQFRLPGMGQKVLPSHPHM